MLFAYLDPGTGSLFIQALLGGVLASIVFFRRFARGLYHKITSKHKKTKPQQEDDSDED